MTAEEIKITATPLDRERCRFTVDRPILFAGGTFQFRSKAETQGYPLAEEIFDLSVERARVAAVQLSGNQVVVAISDPVAWNVVGKEIGRIIREYLISESAHFEQVLADAQGNPDEQIRLRVQRVLDTQVNPAVAGHGGNIRLLDVKGDTAYIKMEGGCQGCGMASVTLKSGVEKAIFQYVPEIKKVLDTTDHASGSNPFYAPSKK